MVTIGISTSGPPNKEDDEWTNFFAKINQFDLFIPRAQRGISLLKKLGCSKVGIVGPCWGSKLAFLLSHQNPVDSVVAPHPSFINEHDVANAPCPFCILPAKDDPPYIEVEQATKQHKLAKFCMYRRWGGLEHGFLGARFDHDNSSKEKKQEQRTASLVVLDFLKKTLLNA